MQHTLSTFSPVKQSRGGRIGSSKLRDTIIQSENFHGLEEGTSRYDLLLLVKKVGKRAGFTSKMIELLDYYMSYTRDIDWEQGARPLVYQALSKTALEMGVSERQIQNLEKALFDLGALTWNDSGNHKRYGQRSSETGDIIYAFGVDLSPLAFLKPKLEGELQKKLLFQKAWADTKRQVSYYRRQIKACIEEIKLAQEQGRGLIDIEAYEASYNAVAGQIRSNMDLTALRELLGKHKHLYAELLDTLSCGSQEPINEAKTQKTSSTSEKNFTHIESTKQLQTNKFVTSSPSDNGFQKSSSRGSKLQEEKPEQTSLSQDQEEESQIKATGLHLITPKQALNTATEEFRNHIPLEDRALDWNDLVEAAFRRKSEINIPQSSWGRACDKLTRYGAAICVLLTDRAMGREEDPVRSPGAYFNGMINKVESRELKLHKSIMGHLKNEFTDEE